MMSKTNDNFEKALNLLPLFLRQDIKNTIIKYRIDQNRISDIRLRACGRSFLSLVKNSFPLTVKLDRNLLADIVYTLAEGSIYTHAETINEGFITSHDLRCGITGRAVTRNGIVTNVYEYTSVSIRIPHNITDCAVPILELYKKHRGGIIIYSPPAVGKTTLLRDLIRLFSDDNAQFSVIDSRGELSSDRITSADFFLFYPKSQGIISAIRSMSPEFIICDELSGNDDADAAIYAYSCGVPIIATAHAGTLQELSKRPENKRIFDSGVFSYAVGIKQKGFGTDFDFDIKEL